LSSKPNRTACAVRGHGSRLSRILASQDWVQDADPAIGGWRAHLRDVNRVRMTSQGGPYTRFRRAFDGGNLLITRAAAAELPRIGVEHAAAMLLVIEPSEQASYERAALRWLAMLCQERGSRIDLPGVAQAAAALNARPSRRPTACSPRGRMRAGRPSRCGLWVFTGRVG
jgi:hypothetical protein